MLTSGNIYKASAQFIVNQHIEKETGKNSLTLIKETLAEETNKKVLEEEKKHEEDKESAKTKLKNLGLTDDEIKTFIKG